MAEPRARIIDGLKFMWDGEDYGGRDEALTAKAGYERDDFESRIVEEGDTVHVYTRRVVAEISTEGEPPA